MRLMFGVVIVTCAVPVLVACNAPATQAQDGRVIVSQGPIGRDACGPCALFNWLSQGGGQLQSVLTELSAEKTPLQTVQHIIDTYGKRESATKRRVTRYGPHNGGVGSVNLMIMAREVLDDHLESPPTLRGEYLHQHEDESTEEHLDRIAGWFSNSIEAGVPVLFYVRSYQRRSDRAKPRMIFGHHIVITSIDTDTPPTKSGVSRARITFVDSGTGRVGTGYLSVARADFTAPTFTYELRDGRAAQTESVRTGRPLLEIRSLNFEAPGDSDNKIVVAHFATFAESQ
ncbi:MAG: hypothetical protein ACR2NP_14255 [Pirellulaceae bacterium]